MDTETTIREILRLRDVQRRSDPALGAELGRTIDALSGAVGRSVKRALAARLLGISQTALDKWIATGEIGVVQTPSGRREVPLGELLELLEDVQSADRAARPVSAALKRRRADLSVDPDLIPWEPGGVLDDHRRADLRALAYHRAVAKRLDEKRIEQARIRLARWEDEGRIDPRWAEEWRSVLSKPVREVADLIAVDSPSAADLRQSSPFAGSLSDRERREILRAVERAVQ